MNEIVNFPTKKYKTIYMDPPWSYGKWGSGSKKSCFSSQHNESPTPIPYNVMSLNDIRDLDIKGIADCNCELYLWTTQRYLPCSFGLIKHWGFKYCQTLTWCKTPMGTGQGGLFTPTTEFLILSRIGSMPKRKRVDTTWWNIKRQNKHSKKPDFFRDMIYSLTDSPRIELFARSKYDGWDCWGNEV